MVNYLPLWDNKIDEKTKRLAVLTQLSAWDFETGSSVAYSARFFEKY